MATLNEDGRVIFGGKSPQALPWNPLPHMQEYLENLAAEGRAASYIGPTKVGLSHFSTFCRSEGVKHPEELTRTHVLRFQGHVGTMTKANGEPLSLQYRQQLLKYVRNWVNWAVELEYITNSPWQRIKIGSTQKKPNPLEDEEVEALFEHHRMGAFSLPPFTFHRREIILLLLYGWGLRIHELAALNVSAMDVRLEWVTARNKGGGTKVLPYSAATKAGVQRWLTQRARHAIVGEDALIIDRSGQRLSIHMIRKVVTELGESAGVTINPHRLRDTFGTTMLDNNVEIERIGAMMGHTRRSQTLAYARLKNPKLTEAHDRVMDPILERLVSGRPVKP